MTVELTVSNVLFILAAFVAALWALVKVISSQQERRLSEKFATLGDQLAGVGKELRAEADATRKLEIAFHKAQAEIARDYVRRDDFLQAFGTITTRIDNMALRVERALTPPQFGARQ
ncbi:hypothetical protein [Variovorax paradoxus]|uniref:hypothetical protein n=1 Tax=Variovorax paradoxus TaxID=34073 RepID=UPI001ABBF155